VELDGAVYELGESACLIRSPGRRVLKVGAPAAKVIEHLQRAGPVPADCAASASPLGAGGSVLDSGLARIGALAQRRDQAQAPVRVSFCGEPWLTALAESLPCDAWSADAPGPEVRVLVLPRFAEATMAEFAAGCERDRATSVSLVFDGPGAVFIGPLAPDGGYPDITDAAGRRLMNAASLEVEQALREAPAFETAPRVPRDVAAAALALLASQLTAWQATGTCALLWRQLEYCPRAGTLREHIVMPLPDRPPAVPPFPMSIESVLDPLTGIVLATYPIRHDREVPSRLKTVQSRAGRVRNLYSWTNNVTCGGSAFDDPGSARLASIGEALERYCGNIPHPGVPVYYGSYRGLGRSGPRPLDPEQIVLFSRDQYTRPGFRFARLNRDTDLHWIEGTNLTTGEPALLPASLCYVNWHRGPYQDYPKFLPLAYPGIAAGPDLGTAIVAGIQEVVERDATMVWWLNEGTVPRLVIGDDLRAIWQEDDCADQRPWALEIPNEFDLPVVAGVVHNLHGPLLNVGFACKPTLRAAILKSWTEALTLQEGSRDLLAEDSRHRGAVTRGELSAKTIRPYRADRSYLDDFSANFEDVDDLMVQQTVFLDPRSVEAVLPKLQGSALQPARSRPAGPDLASWQSRIEQRGYQVYVADLTTPDVAATGVRVVRVLIPGLVSNTPAAYPLLGRGRVQDEALRLGMVAARKPAGALNCWPLPHA
jgi:ribosomal protein S12 methylthiotransferase accessory factor